MKILHTADWHIGQNFMQKSREEEFVLLFDWIVDAISTEKIDVLLISGDIFDVGYPSNNALNLFYDFLTRMLKTNCRKLIITAGNHDAISTLNAPKEILKYLDIDIVASATDMVEDEIIEIKNDANDIELVVCAVPFLRDRDLRQSKAGESYEDRVKALREGIISHYEKIAEATTKYKEKNISLIAMGHLYAAGVKTQDSERDIHIGNLGQVDATKFPQQFDYIALGHIHRPQLVNSCNHIRYSGSPLQLSFSERKDIKKVVIIDAAEGEVKSIKELEVPIFRKLVRFKGSFVEVENKLMAYKSDSKLKDWAELIIEEEKNSTTLITQFNELSSKLTEIEVLKYKIVIAEGQSDQNTFKNETKMLKDMAVEEVFDKLLEKNKEENIEEIKLAFKELLEEMD